MEENLGKTHLLLCPELPFHGNTDWKEGYVLQPAQLWEIINGIFQQEGIAAGKKFSLLAYSMGGRIALYLLQVVPQHIERVVLLAPDGLHTNFWYWIGTQTWLGNKLFSATMKYPAWFFGMANLSYKAGLLNSSIIKFMHQYLDEKTARSLLYRRWTTLRKFKPNHRVIREKINDYHIPVRLVFGSHDQIILSKRSAVLKEDGFSVKVVLLKAGHQLLKNKYAAAISAQFSD